MSISHSMDSSRPGYYKANVDGNVFKDQQSGSMGVIIRDEKGRVVAALSQQFYAPLGLLEVEVKAMEATTFFAKDIGVHDLVFERESIQVYNIFQ